MNKQSYYEVTLAGKQSECDELASRLDNAIVDIKRLDEEKESAVKQSKVESQRVRE